MILYLQSNYNSNYYSISKKIEFKNELFNFDYEELEQVNKKTTFKELYNYLIKKYNCKKLVIQL